MARRVLDGAGYEDAEVRSSHPTPGRPMPIEQDVQMAVAEQIIRHQRQVDMGLDAPVLPRSALLPLMQRQAELAPVVRKTPSIQERWRQAEEASRQDAPTLPASPPILREPRPKRSECLLGADGGVLASYDYAMVICK
jgi:hypothetical protein